MLACERWTLTHSSAWVVLVGLALALALLLGLEAMNASREAETLPDGEAWDDEGEAWDDDGEAWDDDGEAWDDDGEAWDDDGEDELVWDGEPVAEPDAAADAEPEPDGDGDTGVVLGVLVGSVPDDAGAVGEAVPEELEEPDGDGDGDGDFDVGVGVGVGVVVAAAGSTSHLVSVFAAALVEALGLAAAAPALIVPARAAPGQPASTPTARNNPATRLSAAARTCARRMKTALSPLLFEVAVCSLWDS
jgi:hypothetical protein